MLLGTLHSVIWAHQPHKYLVFQDKHDVTIDYILIHQNFTSLIKVHFKVFSFMRLDYLMSQIRQRHADVVLFWALQKNAQLHHMNRLGLLSFFNIKDETVVVLNSDLTYSPLNHHSEVQGGQKSKVSRWYCSRGLFSLQNWLNQRLCFRMAESSLVRTGLEMYFLQFQIITSRSNCS